MYLVPQDVYRNINRYSSDEERAEISEANQSLKKDDFFTNTSSNSKKPHAPIKKANKNQSVGSDQTSEISQSVNDTTIFNTPFQTSSPLQTIKRRRVDTPMVQKNKQFECEKCGKIYSREYHFRRHRCKNLEKKDKADIEEQHEEANEPTPSTSNAAKRLIASDYDPY